MANKIKGITLEIGGDTVGLTKALSKVNKEAGTIQRELKEVDKALKLDPKNTELLTQKQKLLADGIAVTKKKVEALRKAKEKADKDMADGTEVNQEQYRKLQREIVKAESALEDAKKQAEETSEALNKAGDGGKAGKNLSALKGTLGTAAKGVLGFGAAIGGVAVGLSELEESTREYREDLNKLHTAFTSAGKSVQAADKIYKGFFGILGESDRAIEAANHLALLTNNEQELAQWTQIAAGINATFTDSLPIEGLTEAANETAKVGQVTGVLADALNWAGINEDEFNAKLEKLNSEQERSTLITQTLSDTYSDIGTKYMETNSSVVAAREAQLKWNDEMARVGELVAPAKAAVVEFGADAVGAMTNVAAAIMTTTDESQLLVQKIKDENEAWEEMLAMQDEKSEAAVSEIDYTKRLYDELKILADENGNVIDANKNRVSYILNELNEALGIELTLTGNQIQGYKDLGTSIEEMLAKKRAEIILASQEETYKKAVSEIDGKRKEQSELYIAILEQEMKVKEANAKLTDASTSQERLSVLGMQTTLQEMRKTYEDNDSVINEYYANIADYENNYKAIMEGNASAVTAINNSVAESFAVAGEASEEELAKQVMLTAQQYDEIQKKVDAGVKGVTQTMADEALVQYNNAVNEYQKIGKAIPEGMQVGIEDGEPVLKTKIGSFLATVKSWFTNKEDGFDVNSPSKWAEGVAEFVDDGLAKGFINKAGEVTDAAQEVVDGVKDVVKKSEEEIFDEQRKQFKSFIDGLTSDSSSAISRLQSDMDSYKSKLAEIDELAVVPTTTFTGLFGGDDLVIEGTPKLADLSPRIAELTEYHDNLVALKDLGVDDWILEEIKSRGEKEGGLFAQAFLGASPEERELFLSQYEEIGKLAGSTTAEVFQTEIEDATKGLQDVFAEMTPDMLKTGENWGTVLGEGIITKLRESLETVKSMVSMADYTPAAGIVYNTQINQNITATPQTAYETAEQTRRTMENINNQAVLG